MFIEIIISIIILILIGLSAFFSGSETAIISANKIRLKSLADRGDRRARILIRFLEKPERLLGTILVGNNLVNVASTTLFAVLIKSLVQQSMGPDHTKIEGILTTIIMTPLILILGEIVPKSIGRERSSSASLSVSIPMKLVSIMLYPIVIPLYKFISLLSKTNVQDPDRITEEIKALASLSEKEGLIKPEQSEMIHSVFELREQTVERVMVPLVDVVSVNKHASLDEFYEEVTRTRFSRFPVYENRADNITGIVNVSEVLYSDKQIGDISGFVHEDITYLPESKHITSSLRELQASPYPMGVVVDEYGGVAGIVTLEDIVAEIVGDIKDERDQEEEERIFDGSNLECDGRTEIEKINQLLEINIPNEEYETIAGFIISQMDKIPVEGEELVYENLRIKVLEADKRSVLRVRLSIEKEIDNEEAETGNT